MQTSIAQKARVSIPAMSIKSATTGNLSPGACLEFVGTLTATVEDRDGDILQASGARIDEAQALLWQHRPDCPVGKLLGITHRDAHSVKGRFAVADTDLGRDAAKQIEMNAQRLSIGFAPLVYEPRKGGEGWLVKEFDVLETSLVSVPSNVAATIESWRKGAFQSPTVKAWFGKLAESGAWDDTSPVSAGRDPYEVRETCLHESIHAVLADMLGVDFERVTIRKGDDGSMGHLRFRNSTLLDPEYQALDGTLLTAENDYKLNPSRELVQRMESEIVVCLGPLGWGEDIECSDHDMVIARQKAIFLELSSNPRENGHDILKRLGRVAVRMLAQPDVRARVKTLAKELVRKRTLTRQQVRGIAVASEMLTW